LLFTDEIKSIEEDHEKIAQVVKNTEQSHAANVEPKHEKAHSDESIKDTFFPECLVNESRCVFLELIIFLLI
jgi:hypothetical protein